MTCRPNTRRAGFTLLEIVAGLAVIATLAALALPAYRQYAERAELAQLLTQIDQISTAVHVEDATEVRNLHLGAAPGKAPPQLQVVPDTAFNERGGLRLTLIRAPAGFFASSPQVARYGLIADLSGPATERRLRELSNVLPFVAGDKLWLARNQLAFPLVDLGVPKAPTAPAPGTGWEGNGVAHGAGAWTCQGAVTVYGTDGKPLTGVNAGVQIRVVLAVTAWDGTQTERSWTDQGNLGGGKARFTLDGLGNGAGRSEHVTACKLQVTGIQYYYPTEPPVKWDGRLAVISIPAPPAGGATQAVQARPPCPQGASSGGAEPCQR